METRTEQPPSERCWHSSFAVGGCVYTWGGRTTKFAQRDVRRDLSREIFKYDPRTENWSKKTTEGTPHPGLSAAACVAIGDQVYFYGGYDGKKYRGVLSKLDMTTLKWSQLSAEDDQPDCPMKKVAAGLAYFFDSSGRKYLSLFGGYGKSADCTKRSATESEADYDFFNEDDWTDEFHVFNLDSNLWSSPILKGKRPPPCSHFSFTNIDKQKVAMFGGYVRLSVDGHNQAGDGFRVNDLYIFDFDDMMVTKLPIHEPPPMANVNDLNQCNLYPPPRSDHAACCLGFGTDSPHLLVSGGVSKQLKALKDIWLFNLKSRKWDEIKTLVHDHPSDKQPRSLRSHSATVVPLCSVLGEVIMFGGSVDNFVDGRESDIIKKINETTIITFGQIGSEWSLVDMTTNSQRGNRERIAIKMKEIDYINKLLKEDEPSTHCQLKYRSGDSLNTFALYRMSREDTTFHNDLCKIDTDFKKQIKVDQPTTTLIFVDWLKNPLKSDCIKPTWANCLVILSELSHQSLVDKMKFCLLQSRDYGINHFEVCGYLEDLCECKIRQLGQVLGLKHSSQEKFSNHSSKMVTAWLNGGDDVTATSEKPRWETLVKALKQIGDNGEEIAEIIEVDHEGNLKYNWVQNLQLKSVIL